jgi:hypothetical protein
MKKVFIILLLFMTIGIYAQDIDHQVWLLRHNYEFIDSYTEAYNFPGNTGITILYFDNGLALMLIYKEYAVESILFSKTLDNPYLKGICAKDGLFYKNIGLSANSNIRLYTTF